MVIAIGTAIAVAWIVGLRGSHPVAAAAIAVASGVHPALGATAAGTAFGVHRARGIASTHRAAAISRAERLVAIELVADGVAAGVSFDRAVESASGFIAYEVGTELRRYLRMSRSDWLPRRDASPIESMFFLAQASASSGAPLADELRRLSDHYRSLELTAERERLERLPVKMLFPLAFLILPGFLLVAVVPAVAGGLAKLTL